MEELEFLKLLKDKKIADAYQYYKACLYKLYLAEISFEALTNVITEYQQREKSIVEKVYDDAITKGKGSFNTHANNVNYLGIEVSPTIMIDKLTIEIMSLLHNFFDTFAQWLNAGLFAEDGVPMERVSLSKVVGKFSQFPEYTGKFIADIMDLPVSLDYQYIADFNNTLKHRRQIYIENKFDILNIKGSVMIPGFEKDGRPYMKENVLPVLRNKIDFCKNILDESETYIKAFYSQCDNQHVLHRIYNPKTYFLFENEEDYKKFSSPKSHYHYIEVDKNNIADEYHIMLTCDRMDDDLEKSIELFNSVYPIVMLREEGTTKIIGILKPIDEEVIDIRNEGEVKYRKYIPQLSNYEQEMFKAMCGNEVFHYYPFLSDTTVEYFLSKDK